MERKYRQKYLDNLAKGVEGMWLKQQNTDVTVKAGNKTYRCHRVILGSLSNYFKELFLHKQEETVDVLNIESQTFETVLLYIYTGKTEDVEINTEKVLSAAVQLQIPCLQDICEDFLVLRLTSETCVGIYKLASDLGCASLVKQSLVYILEHFESVTKCKTFMNLSVDELIAIINVDDLNASSEEVVCDAVLGWIAEDPKQRSIHLEKLFNFVRYPLLSEEYLEKLKRHVLLSNSESGLKILNKITNFRNTGHLEITVNPRQFQYRTEELICVVGTRSRQPNPESTEIKCFSFNKEKEYSLASIPEEPGARFAVCSSDNDVYLSGGYLGQKRMLRYSATDNEWEICADMSEGRWGHCMTAIDGHIYIVGGSKKVPAPISEIEMYNTRTNVTTVVGSLAIPVSFAAVATLGKNVYIFGGKSEKKSSCGKVQCFDTDTNSCKVVCDMPEFETTVSRTAVVDNTIYIFYGHGEVVTFKDDALEVSPTGIAFDHFGVVVHGGRILIDGCYGNQYSTMMFDPATKTIEQYSRPVKAALCNFYCMPIVINRNILQHTMI
ncbi:kelch-like protein 24a [Ruditapes philippinarum]|uniref:kelch-like protein 24a n=1 Tax=Ruditapes philippinarum TaxID=129788 RepID=UPI00295AF124|nr:kelch-like protein 24a [Ruditapes philippinarum]